MNGQWTWQQDRQASAPGQAMAFAERTALQDAPLPAFSTLPRHATLPPVRVPPRIPCPTLGMP